MDAILPVLREFGFPIALCAVLLLAIRFQNAQLAKAYAQLVAAHMDRIRTLEGIVCRQGERIEGLEADRIRRADEYATSLKDVAGRCASALRDMSAWMDKVWSYVVTRQPGEYHATTAQPPAPPVPPARQPDTAVLGGRA